MTLAEMFLAEMVYRLVVNPRVNYTPKIEDKQIPRCSAPLKVLIPIIRKDIICLRVSPNVVLMFVVNMVQTSNRGNPNFSIIKFFVSNKKGY